MRQFLVTTTATLLGTAIASLTNLTPVQAVILTNQNFSSSPQLSNVATGWTNGTNTQFGGGSLESLFDGITDDFSREATFTFIGDGITSLSPNNFVGITIDLDGIYNLTSIKIANDSITMAGEEVSAMEVILNGKSNEVTRFSVDNLNDGNLQDIDDIFTNQTIAGVTSIEFRVTESERLGAFEIREFVISGDRTSESVPEPSTLLGLLAFGVIGKCLLNKRTA
ncbi:MAG: PEP-CTERM sorting domain-containing protein [Cyanobacteria bacterium SBLK]|nr:PEP-CTERM sorting domain-containing protein [Cyanobacteria bacterium SBLK]